MTQHPLSPSYELVYHERVSAIGLNLALSVQQGKPHPRTERS